MLTNVGFCVLFNALKIFINLRISFKQKLNIINTTTAIERMRGNEKKREREREEEFLVNSSLL